MIKQLVIHIGQHKTGSTSIQSAFATGKVVSPTTKLFYPGNNSHNNVAKTLLKAELAQQKAARFSALAKRFAKSNADIGIISAENFEFVRPMALLKALKQFFPDHADTARIIAYVRPHAARLVSGFSERTKNGSFNGSLADFHEWSLAKGTFLYHNRFDKWQSIFNGRLALRPMVRHKLRNGYVVHDFLHTALGHTDFKVANTRVRNQSLYVESLSIVRELQIAMKDAKNNISDAAGWKFANFLDDVTPVHSATKLQLHRALAQDIMHAYRKDADLMDASFFGEGILAAELCATPDNMPDTAQSILLEDNYDAALVPTIRTKIALAAEQISQRPAETDALLRELIENLGTHVPIT